MLWITQAAEFLMMICRSKLLNRLYALSQLFQGLSLELCHGERMTVVAANCVLELLHVGNTRCAIRQYWRSRLQDQHSEYGDGRRQPDGQREGFRVSITRGARPSRWAGGRYSDLASAT